jgi:hypothetical protein
MDCSGGQWAQNEAVGHHAGLRRNNFSGFEYPKLTFEFHFLLSLLAGFEE